MPATLANTGGAFTTLQTDLSQVQETVARDRMITVRLAAADLATIPDEIRQVIALFQIGWGAQLGANVRLAPWATALLLRDYFTAFVNQGVPR